MRFDFDPLAPGATLDACADAVARAFPGVKEISTAELVRLGPVTLLDIREPEEWHVSRLAGALRVEPGGPPPKLDPATTIVCYCAVGLRSARMAQTLLKSGHADVRNLRGGIFAWAQAGGALVDATGPTTTVHPFDARWGKLLGESGVTRW